MKSREEILETQIHGWQSNDQSVFESNVLTVLLDIRELLMPRKNGKKVIEVQLTDKEVELLSKLESHA